MLMKVINLNGGCMGKDKHIVGMRLSKRERQVMDLLTKGLSLKMVAFELKLSYDTVDTYVRRIYAKLDVHCRVEAVVTYLTTYAR